MLENMSRVNCVAFIFRKLRAERSAKPGRSMMHTSSASELNKVPQQMVERVAQDETIEIEWGSVYQDLELNNSKEGWSV